MSSKVHILHSVVETAEKRLEGKSYPQEGPITFEGFESYFFTTASTTVIGTLHPSSSSLTSLEEARAGRTWEECVGGCYYMSA